ncbi:Unknown protein [Striga hermonthica]|uniref:Bet v I/Major latex protein domain-containing protein n=1 Tax=Striga hermonthica TaxID=68872 RepID=A0A9N7MYP8_STRHE|nr:Unknown protein [Striga hermonthica]
MGIKKFFQELKTKVSPSRLFKAMIIDSQQVLPNIASSIKSVEIVQGNAIAAGCVVKTTFDDGAPFKDKDIRHKEPRGRTAIDRKSARTWLEGRPTLTNSMDMSEDLLTGTGQGPGVESGPVFEPRHTVDPCKGLDPSTHVKVSTHQPIKGLDLLSLTVDTRKNAWYKAKSTRERVEP